MTAETNSNKPSKYALFCFGSNLFFFHFLTQKEKRIPSSIKSPFESQVWCCGVVVKHTALYYLLYLPHHTTSKSSSSSSSLIGWVEDEDDEFWIWLYQVFDEKDVNRSRFGTVSFSSHHCHWLRLFWIGQKRLPHSLTSHYYFFSLFFLPSFTRLLFISLCFFFDLILCLILLFSTPNTIFLFLSFMIVGINAPTSQSFLNYVFLAIVYGSILLYRRKPLKVVFYSHSVVLLIVGTSCNIWWSIDFSLNWFHCWIEPDSWKLFSFVVWSEYFLSYTLLA